MITVDINNKTVILKYLLLDYTGTLSENGKLIDGVFERLNRLSNIFNNIFVLTSDTFNNAKEQLKDVNADIKIFDGSAKKQKLDFMQTLGNSSCAAVGNGNNDTLMLKYAQLSIVVINRDGCYAKLINSADIVTCSINDALDLFLDKRKIVALLRN